MIATSITVPNQRIGIWLVGVSFVLFQFFMQLSSGVVIGAIMQEFDLTAFVAGLLGSSLYIVYTSLQIPVGILYDRKNSRTLMATNAFICSIGCIVFASSHTLLGLFIGRFLIGAGSAFAFIGLSHILRQHFPLRQFPFMIGLSETLGFIVTVIGMVSLGSLLNYWGWRGFISGAGIVGLLISFLCYRFIPDSEKTHPSTINYSQQFFQIISNKRAWVNGLFVGLSFTIVTVFGALWAVPFIKVKLSCSLAEASFIGALFFLGAGVSCPLFAILAIRFRSRKLVILSSCLSTTLLVLLALFAPVESHAVMGILMFLIGICCGAYMLAYTIANELAPANSLSTCTGFTNTLAVITAPLLQPLIGLFLDNLGQTENYTVGDYQIALLAVPVSLIIAAILVLFLPDPPEVKM
ncbi:major facilitator family transporter (plasmid) [Legionella adelaidensis]|uniref:Major facilitator family transporter n=1 Tax=Legionella adelaidensis TaxID=45056 RepID=A0A0W0R3E9_9GAMM|nr:MFS transporter [Legionella adelaidensis]KTC65600.1 major facilitator family transporter [Legionella adelaidensis]VEH85203.1 major facilitator family transporter [Legionella adelaidensis]